MCICVCVCRVWVRECEDMSMCSHGSPKRELNPVEIQPAVSHQMWGLQTQLGPSGRVVSIPTQMYQSGFSRVTELMESLYSKGICWWLTVCSPTPTTVSSSCEWKSKDLAVVQSHKASRQRSVCVFLLPMSLCRSPAEGLVQIKGVFYHAWIWDLFCHRLTLNTEISLP